MKLKYLVFVMILLSFSLCTNEMKIIKKIKIFSSDKSQCITILTGYKYRYIIVGNHNKVPEDNYVKLDARDLGVIGDIFYGCWNKNGYEWELYSFSSKIIENKLDKTKYKFEREYPKDSNLNVKEGRCFDFDYINPKIIDKHKGIVFLEIN